MKLSILALLCILLSSEVTAQSTLNNLDPRILRGNQPLMPRGNNEIEIKGHPFSTDEWQSGSIILQDSSRSEDLKLKFKLNVEDSEIWVLSPDKTERILTDTRIAGLILIRLDTIVEYRKFLLPEETSPRFAQVIHNGKNFTLIKYQKKTFVKANYTDKGLVVVGNKYDTFESVEAYYLLSQNKKGMKINLSKGDILKATASVSRPKREEILQYCKENDIRNPLNEEDAILMLTYIDGL